MKFYGGRTNLRGHGGKGAKGCTGLKRGRGKDAHKHHQGDSRRKQAGRTPTRQMVGSDILRRPGKVLSGAVLTTVLSGAKRSSVLSDAVLSGAETPAMLTVAATSGIVYFTTPWQGAVWCSAFYGAFWRQRIYGAIWRDAFWGENTGHAHSGDAVCVGGRRGKGGKGQ